MNEHDELDLRGVPEHDARELFAHGALRTLLDDARTQDAVESALARLPARRSTWQRSRPALAWAAAAALLVALALFATRPSQELLADVDRIAARSVDGSDAVYRGLVRFDDEEALEYRLYARGQAFAISIPIRGRQLWFGHDGSDDWYIPLLPRSPVLVGPRLFERPELSGPGGPLAGQRVPFLRVAQLLARVRSAYRVREGEAASARRIDVRGERRAATDPRRPDRLRILADRATHRLERLELEWDRDRRGRRQRNTLELIEEKVLDPALYRHDAHHGARRRVQRVAGTAAEYRRR